MYSPFPSPAPRRNPCVLEYTWRVLGPRGPKLPAGECETAAMPGHQGIRPIHACLEQCAKCRQSPSHPNAHSDLKVLVLGDSIMWGDGLPPAEKFVALFGQQLANLSGRTVRVISYAHSGARLGKIDDMNSVMFQGPDGKPYGDLDSGKTPPPSSRSECAAGQHPDAEIVLLRRLHQRCRRHQHCLARSIQLHRREKIAAGLRRLPAVHGEGPAIRPRPFPQPPPSSTLITTASSPPRVARCSRRMARPRIMPPPTSPAEQQKLWK